jgi:hypothetical protein
MPRALQRPLFAVFFYLRERKRLAQKGTESTPQTFGGKLEVNAPRGGATKGTKILIGMTILRKRRFGSLG